jgi:nitrile hydratase
MTPGAKFKPGDPVRVRTGHPPGHIRTPAYIRGKTGRVAAVHGAFRNPESLAFGGEGLPKLPLYLVGFAQAEVWDRYVGSPRDTLYVDIYEHWLEPA